MTVTNKRKKRFMDEDKSSLPGEKGCLIQCFRYRGVIRWRVIQVRQMSAGGKSYPSRSLGSFATEQLAELFAREKAKKVALGIRQYRNLEKSCRSNRNE